MRPPSSAVIRLVLLTRNHSLLSAGAIRELIAVAIIRLQFRQSLSNRVTQTALLRPAAVDSVYFYLYYHIYYLNMDLRVVISACRHM